MGRDLRPATFDSLWRINCFSQSINPIPALSSLFTLTLMSLRLIQLHHQLATSLSARAGLVTNRGNLFRSRSMASSKRMIHTAGCIIIGDEVLGGKTTDTNSTNFAKYCFGLGIDLKRIEVIGDDESEIIEATRRMSDNYDFVVTSGGIGPTSVNHCNCDCAAMIVDEMIGTTTLLINP